MADMDEGVSISAASCDLNVAVMMKNVRSKNATSVIAVISVVGGCFFGLTFAMAIYKFLLY